jgi:transcriptional regulator of nitric oxide reductase
MARRARAERHRLKALLDVMRAHELAPPEKVEQLKTELNRYHHTQAFDGCDSMGDLVRQHLWQMLAPGAQPVAG